MKASTSMTIKSEQQDLLIGQILKTFDILRGTVDSVDWSIILLLLSLYKDGYLKNVDSGVDVYDLINDNLNKSDEEIAVHYKTIIQNFYFHQISNTQLFKIFLEFESLDKNVLNSDFPEIFDKILYTLSDSMGKMSGEFIQPHELTRLISSLIELPENAKVFNPFAGAASFGISLKGNYQYLGQELNRQTWAIGFLRILVHKKMESCKLMPNDSFLSWPEGSFDLVISHPPFSVKRFTINHSEYRTSEGWIVSKCIESLSESGKSILVLPRGILFRGGAERLLRKKLIELDLIEGIISLPAGILRGTGIPIIVLILNKKKPNKESVKLIDATSFYFVNKRHKILDGESIVELFYKENHSGFIRVVSNNQIGKNDYNLNLTDYFLKEFEGTPLSEIVTRIKGERITLPSQGKVVSFRDLKDDEMDYILDISKIEEVPLKRIYTKLEEPCILIAPTLQRLKPTYFEYKETPIYISNSILAFKVEKDNIDIEYLVRELQSEYVGEQLQGFERFTASPLIPFNDLMKIKIKLISIGEQLAKVKGLNVLTDKIKQLKKERNRLAHGKSVSDFNEMASLKHTLGRPRQNILDWSINLIDFFKEVDSAQFKNLDQEYKDFYELSIIDSLKEIKTDIEFITEVLEKGEQGLKLEEYPLEIISLSDVNEKILSISGSNYNFTLRKEEVNEEEMEGKGINANLVVLKILIDNILTNANKHGFQDNKQSNEVVIELSILDDVLILEIKNNGSPFPNNMDKDKFITKFSTANTNRGTGLGGYDIDRIAKYFGNPSWSLELNQDIIYPVIFKFEFTIKPI